MKTKLRAVGVVLLAFIPLCLYVAGYGCATVAPGNDPLVVDVERTQAVAGQTFDFVLHERASNRSFWRTNAPGFNNFCDWLVTPMPYSGSNMPRALVMQVNLDDLKVAYKQAKTAGNSNALFTAEAVINTALSQANAWITVATNSFH